MAERPEFPKEPDWSIPELFVDEFISMMTADGCVYLTFGTRRSEGAPQGRPPKIKTVTTARLVMTVPAAGLLMDQLTSVFGLLEQQGIVKRAPQTPVTPNSKH